MGDNLPQWLSVALQLAEILGGLVGAAGGVLWFMARHTMVTKAELQAHEAEHGKTHDRIAERFDRGETRFNAMSQSIANLPGRAEHDAIKAQVTAVDRAVAQLGAKMDAIGAMLERIERPLNIMVEERLRK